MTKREKWQAEKLVLVARKHREALDTIAEMRISPIAKAEMRAEQLADFEKSKKRICGTYSKVEEEEEKELKLCMKRPETHCFNKREHKQSRAAERFFAGTENELNCMDGPVVMQ